MLRVVYLEVQVFRVHVGIPIENRLTHMQPNDVSMRQQTDQ